MRAKSKTRALVSPRKTKKNEDLVDIEDLVGMSRMSHANDAKDLLPKALVRWYDANRRLLPWRGDPQSVSIPEECEQESKKKGKANTVARTVAALSQEERVQLESERVQVSPYQTWVSEIMLQQTRVETVIGYFNRWMRSFPTVDALANASEDQVNALWAGLGYYRRARNLHLGAKKVVDELGSVLPNNVKDLLTIPGIGEYTAGAVSSIAFGRPVPLVDGNVIRVFSRLCAANLDAKDKGLAKSCWKLAENIVPQERPGDFNQALMELGATVCTPQVPKCGVCPIQTFCKAYENDPNSVTQYPAKSLAKVLPEEIYAVTVYCRPNESRNIVSRKRKSNDSSPDSLEYLLVRRPSKGLLAGQWEFIAGLHKRRDRKTEDGESEIDFTYERRRELIETCMSQDKRVANHAPCSDCISNSLRQDLGSFTHTFSHIRHILHVESVFLPKCQGCREKVQRLQTEEKEVAWMTPEDMHSVGLTKSTSTCLQMAQNCQSGEIVPKKRASDGKPLKRVRKEDKKQKLLTTFLVKKVSS